jgi:hypothetical protein
MTQPWSDAIAEVAGIIKQTIALYGADAVGVYSGR